MGPGTFRCGPTTFEEVEHMPVGEPPSTHPEHPAPARTSSDPSRS